MISKWKRHTNSRGEKKKEEIGLLSSFVSVLDQAVVLWVQLSDPLGVCSGRAGPRHAAASPHPLRIATSGSVGWISIQMDAGRQVKGNSLLEDYGVCFPQWGRPLLHIDAQTTPGCASSSAWGEYFIEFICVWGIGRKKWLHVWSDSFFHLLCDHNPRSKSRKSKV